MDLSPKKDWLLVLVAAYVIQQIFWGDGWTETNIALVVCLVVAVGTGIFLRTPYGQRMEQKRLEEKKRYREEQERLKKQKPLTAKEERKRDRREMRRLEREAKKEEAEETKSEETEEVSEPVSEEVSKEAASEKKE